MNLTSAKIVKVERNGKKQACMFSPLPRRLLSYAKIVKVGRNGKKQACMFFPLPRRREPRRNRNRMVERRAFCALEINLLLCKQYKTLKIQDHII